MTTATVSAGPAWLFVPGSQPRMFEKAAASQADAVILDLEDAVSAEAKGDARDHVRRWLESGARPAYVRVNARTTSWHRGDLEALRELPGLLGVMLPKVESPEDVHIASTTLQRMPLIALVETSRGMLGLARVAACRGVARLAMGTVDLASDLGVEEDSPSIDVAGTMLVLNSRSAGLPAPIAGVSRGAHDIGSLRSDADKARSIGYAAKMCIHPAQLAPVRDAFTPSDEDYRTAVAVVEAVEQDANAQLRGGLMLDAAVLGRARRVIADYRRVQGTESPAPSADERGRRPPR